jgi:thiol-disulfide isomerase/thioredoxin
MERTGDRLSHLATALEKLGQVEEASAIETEASNFLAESVRRRFTAGPVADFSVESLAGGRFSLSDLRGKVVLINFWATWCVPCIQEMPSLKRLYDKYRAKGLEVVSVATDEDAAKIGAFVKDHQLSFSLVRDQSLSKQFGIEALPANLFVDRQGRIRFRKIGFEETDQREIEAAVIELLK